MRIWVVFTRKNLDRQSIDNQATPHDETLHVSINRGSWSSRYKQYMQNRDLLSSRTIVAIMPGWHDHLKFILLFTEMLKTWQWSSCYDSLSASLDCLWLELALCLLQLSGSHWACPAFRFSGYCYRQNWGKNLFPLDRNQEVVPSHRLPVCYQLYELAISTRNGTERYLGQTYCMIQNSVGKVVFRGNLNERLQLANRQTKF